MLNNLTKATNKNHLKKHMILYEPNVLGNELESYYNKLIMNSSFMIYNKHYFDLVFAVYIYDNKVFKQNFIKNIFLNKLNIFLKKKVGGNLINKNVLLQNLGLYMLTPKLFMYLVNVESSFNNLVSDLFISFYKSYYCINKTNKLKLFWEQFFLVIIESNIISLNTYESVNKQILDLYDGELAHVNRWHNLTDLQLTNINILESFNEQHDNIFTEYFYSLLYNYNESFSLLCNGLKINFSLSELAFFDYYETWIKSDFNTEEDYFDFQHISRFKFFDDDYSFFLEKYKFNKIEFDQQLIKMTNQANLKIDESEDDFFKQDVELGGIDLKSYLSYSNYYLGESYKEYFIRYNAIKNNNIFLSRIFLTYIKNNVSFLENSLYQSVFNYLSIINNFTGLNLKQKGHYILSIDKMLMKFELIYYYIYMYFYEFSKKKFSLKKNFNYSYLRLFFFSIFFFFKKITVTYTFHYFFIKSYSCLFDYFLLVYFKKYINYQYLSNMQVKNIYNIIQNKILMWSLGDFYMFIKYVYKKLIKFLFLFLKSLMFVSYRKLFVEKYGFLFKKLLKIDNFLNMFKFFSLKKQSSDKVLKKNDLVFNIFYKTCDVSFRSFLSTISIYIKDTGAYKLHVESLMFLYFYNKFELKEQLFFNNLKKNNMNYSINYYKNNLVEYDVDFNDLSVISQIESEIIDCFELVKSHVYHEYEDEEDDNVQHYFEDDVMDEWFYVFNIGDLTDDYEDEEEFIDLTLESPFELDGYDDSVENYESEEFNLELSLDSTFLELFDNPNINENGPKAYNLWAYRYRYLFGTYYYIILNSIRTYIFNFYKYYKTHVSLSGLFMVDENFSENFFNVKMKQFPKDKPLEDEDENIDNFYLSYMWKKKKSKNF